MVSWKNDKELFQIIRKHLYTAVVGDIMDEKGLVHQFLPPNVRPLRDDMVIVGRAMTVLEADMDVNTGIHNPTLAKPFGNMLDALDDLREDEVYLCSGSSPTYAVVGEIMATRAKHLKAAGFAVDGFIRDTPGILKLDIPVFSLGCYSQDQNVRGKVIDYRVPINVGNVHVNPGDIVFGDIDGVVIVPQEREEEIITESYERAVEEKDVEKAIKAGMSAKEAFAKYGIM